MVSKSGGRGQVRISTAQVIYPGRHRCTVYSHPIIACLGADELFFRLRDSWHPKARDRTKIGSPAWMGVYQWTRASVGLWLSEYFAASRPEDDETRTACRFSALLDMFEKRHLRDSNRPDPSRPSGWPLPSALTASEESIDSNSYISFLEDTSDIHNTENEFIDDGQSNNG
jgi:hypothetical protein